MAFSPHGRTLATSHNDGTAVLWDVGSQQPIGSPLPGLPDAGRGRSSHPTAIASLLLPPRARDPLEVDPEVWGEARVRRRRRPHTPSSGMRSCPSRTTSPSAPRGLAISTAPVPSLYWGPGGPQVGSFSGRLKAKEGCEKGRAVTVYDDRLYGEAGSDKSNDRGKYKIFYAPDTTGPFVAVARNMTITKNNGDKIVCRPGRSNRDKLELP